jgi:hypothetical protein
LLENRKVDLQINPHNKKCQDVLLAAVWKTTAHITVSYEELEMQIIELEIVQKV